MNAASRPAECEANAVRKIVRLVARTGCRTHILHVSSGLSVDVLRRAKAEGLPVSAETCPHYLTLDCDHIPDNATAVKCCPPIRDLHEQDALWAGFFYAMVPLLGIPVCVEHVHFESLQGDVEFLRILEKMGCTAQDTEKGVLLLPPSALSDAGTQIPAFHGITVDIFPRGPLSPKAEKSFNNGHVFFCGFVCFGIFERDRICFCTTANISHIFLQAACSEIGLS